MKSCFKVESGVQLLARLTHRPNLSQLSPALASDLPAGAVLEVSGSAGTGKSLIAADAVCRALLPLRCGGCGAGVVVFNTDGNFNVDWLLTSLRNRLIDSVSIEGDSKVKLVESIMQEILPNLVISDVYDSLQLLVSIENLETVLADNPNVSLVVFDTLTAFYWSDQGGKLHKMDGYLKNLIRRIQKVTKEFKVTILYSRPAYFGTKQDGVDNLEACIKDPLMERVNCRIQLSKVDGNLNEKDFFQSATSTSEDTKVKYFRMEECEIIWFDTP